MARSIRKFSETLDIRSLFINRLRSHRLFPIAVVAVVLLSVSCIHVWQRVRVMALVHETALLRDYNRQIVDASKKLRDEIATLSAASRIEGYAVDTLGMIRVPAERMFTLEREEHREEPMDELAQVFSSIRRLADYFPVVTETQASAGEVPELQVDLESEEDGR